MRIPNMASVSELRNRHLEVIERLQDGPVLLASHNQPMAVLVSPEHWNRLMDRLEDLSDLVDALTIELEIERGESELEPADMEELETMARGGHVSA